MTTQLYRATRKESYLKHLQRLWGLDDGKDTWVWWFPPICFVGLPLGFFVTLLFTWVYIKSKKTGQPLPKDWE